MALVVDREAPFEERVVVGDEHPAIAAGDRLVLVEAVRPDRADAADSDAAIRGTEGLGAILDDRDSVRVGNGLQLRHPGRTAQHMDDDDRGGSWRDLRLDVGWIEV